jgi:hypothetical protein
MELRNMASEEINAITKKKKKKKPSNQVMCIGQ